MTVSKSWAYTSEWGKETISAWQITQERARYGGKPLPKTTYWSNHQIGLRKPMKQVQRDGGRTTYFSYKVPGDSAGGPGESLSHKLLKQAIAQMSGTKLKLDQLGEHDIEITHAETEKLILDTQYRADAYLRFISSSSLSLRWSGEVYIEVHHTHEVRVAKQEALRRLKAPVVEVPMHDIFLYPHEDESTTDPLEVAHVTRLCNLLQKGFLKGNIISDRRSAEFLEQQLAQLHKKHKLAIDQLNEANNSTCVLAEQLKASSEHNNALASQHRTDEKRITELEGRNKVEKAKVNDLRNALEEAHATTANEVRKRHKIYWVSAGLISLTAMVEWLSAPRTTSQNVTHAPQSAPAATVAEPVAPAQSIAVRHARKINRRHTTPRPERSSADAADQQLPTSPPQSHGQSDGEHDAPANDNSPSDIEVLP